jgi:hypothetical protein
VRRDPRTGNIAIFAFTALDAGEVFRHQSPATFDAIARTGCGFLEVIEFVCEPRQDWI